jgi:hypothetical protein
MVLSSLVVGENEDYSVDESDSNGSSDTAKEVIAMINRFFPSQVPVRHTGALQQWRLLWPEMIQTSRDAAMAARTTQSET